MYKYLICIILGILLFLLYNNYNSFSVGVPEWWDKFKTACASTLFSNPNIDESIDVIIDVSIESLDNLDIKEIKIIRGDGIILKELYSFNDLSSMLYRRERDKYSRVIDGNYKIYIPPDLPRNAVEISRIMDMDSLDDMEADEVEDLADSLKDNLNMVRKFDSLIVLNIPDIDLTTIIEDKSKLGPIFEDDAIATTNKTKKADLTSLPCKLKVRNGSSLNYVSIVNFGARGIVYKYSTHFENEGQDGYISVAIKEYKGTGPTKGQNDPEIGLIQSMTESSQYRGLNLCDIVNARILSVGESVGKYMSKENICIMEFMDGNLEEKILYISSDETKKNLVRNITNVFKCISYANYIYTDFKPENTLYKNIIHAGEPQLKFFLGDIGSIILKHPPDQQRTGFATFATPEYRFQLIDYNNTDDTMIWNIGVLISLLYNTSNKVNEGILIHTLKKNKQRLVNLEYTNVITKVIQELESKQIDAQLLEIAQRTLTTPERRMSLDEIFELLN